MSNIVKMKWICFLLMAFIPLVSVQGKNKKNLFFPITQESFPVSVKPYPQGNLPYFPVKVSRVVFPSPVKSPIPCNNKVSCLYFEPTHKKSKEAIILLPWWKARTDEKIRYIGHLLATSGFNVLFLPLAYQYDRAPKGVGSGNWTVSKNLSRTRQAIIQSVKDIQRGATWLIQKRGISPRKLGIMGISLGGFVASIAYSVDSRFQGAVILLAGGDFPKMVKIQMRRYSLLMKNKKVRGELREFKKILKNQKAEIKKTFQLLDPIRYAHPKRGKRVLMINGIFDPIVPYECSKSLAKAFHAKQISLPCGHYTALAFLPYILYKTIFHFKKIFHRKLYKVSMLRHLSPKEAEELLKKNWGNPDFLILDVRTQAERELIWLEGSSIWIFMIPS